VDTTHAVIVMEASRPPPLLAPQSRGTFAQESPKNSPTGYTICETQSHKKSGLALEPSAAGLSVVRRGDKTILLGNAANALAAVDNTLPEWDVTHIICVASRKNADRLRAQASGMMMRINPSEPAIQKKEKRKRRRLTPESEVGPL
jgi:hypothetical protein